MFAKRMLQAAEKSPDALHTAQIGGRRRHTPHLNMFYNIISRNLIHQLKTNGAYMDNDATGCYDRINFH